MKAVVINKTGGPEVLSYEEKAPVPVLGDNEVLVKNVAAGLNFIDTYHRTGLYPMPLPFVPGREGAGTVQAVGKNVQSFKVGARVAFLSQGAKGSYAELCAVPADKVLPVPDGLDLKLAAASLLQGLTAHYLTHSTYPIKAGDTVLVHAGAGGTGGLVVEMAKLRGARVITTVGSPEKAEIAKSLGADVVIDYSKTDFVAEVAKLTDGKGVQCVYDGVGKATWEGSLKSVARRGLLVLFGNASGPVPLFDPLLLSKQGSIFVTRPTLVDYAVTFEELSSRANDLFSYMRDGKVHIRVAKEFPLAQAAAAQEYLTSRQAAGKVLLIP